MDDLAVGRGEPTRRGRSTVRSTTPTRWSCTTRPAGRSPSTPHPADRWRSVRRRLHPGDRRSVHARRRTGRDAHRAPIGAAPVRSHPPDPGRPQAAQRRPGRRPAHPGDPPRNPDPEPGHPAMAGGRRRRLARQPPRISPRSRGSAQQADGVAEPVLDQVVVGDVRESRRRGVRRGWRRHGGGARSAASRCSRARVRSMPAGSCRSLNPTMKKAVAATHSASAPGPATASPARRTWRRAAGS
jgi:hypothetical protein